MRRLTIFILCLLVIFSVSLQAGITKPSGVGFLWVGTRHDASQIGGSGLGAGFEVNLRYTLVPRFNLTTGMGILNATDAVFETDRVKSVFLPSVEIRSEYQFMGSDWFKPYIMAGFHLYNIMSENGEGIELEDQGKYQWGSIMAGLGFHLSLGSSRYFLQMSWDYRSALFSNITPTPQYWVMKAGLSISIGNYAWAKNDSDPSELNPEYALFGDEMSEGEISTVSSSSSNVEKLQARVAQLEKMMTNQLQGTNIEPAKEYYSDSVQNITEPVQDVPVDIPVQNVPVQRMGEGTYRAMYKNALELYYQMDYNQAKSVLTRLTQNNPNHELTSNCYYWIGECYYCLGEYQSAVQSLEQVSRFNTSFKLDDALLMKGQCYLNMGRKDLANTAFQDLLTQYPDSEYAARAQGYIKSL